jgi:hypothetical protein
MTVTVKIKVGFHKNNEALMVDTGEEIIYIKKINNRFVSVTLGLIMTTCLGKRR